MTVTKLGIAGAGTMGTGIALAAASSGVEVRLQDISEDQLAAAKHKIVTYLARQVAKERLTEDSAREIADRIETVTDMNVFAACDMVIEAVFEDFKLKADLFEALSERVRGDMWLATNTSCLTVSGLARHVKAPERFLGLHFFSPAEINPIVEVVRGEASHDDTIAAGLDFTKAIGKRPILCKDSPGFAINRFFCPYTNEAARALEAGLGTTADIDRVARQTFGAAAGPFLVMNLIKPRINLNAIRNLDRLGPFYAPAQEMVRIGDAGLDWEIGEETAPDEAADKKIADMLMGGTFLAVLQCLDEQVASAADIDFGASQALKFTRPPCAIMDDLGMMGVERLIRSNLHRYKLPTPGVLASIGQLAA